MSAPRHLGRTPAKGGGARRCRNAHHGETVLAGKPPPGVDSVLRWILRPARIVTGMSSAMNGGAVGLAKCRVQSGRRGGGLVAAEAMTGKHDLLDAARNGDQDASARLGRPCLPSLGLLPSNAQAPFRAGHGAMDFGAGPDQYQRGSRSS
jgi:hypothetical protein